MSVYKHDILSSIWKHSWPDLIGHLIFDAVILTLLSICLIHNLFTVYM